MDSKHWLKHGEHLLEFIANYLDTVGQRPVFTEVEPGYLRALLPEGPPTKPESWEKIIADFAETIMPGLTHWQHPRFHAYFPSGNSYPAILAGMLSDGIGCLGFTWASCPASAELEMLMLDWVGKMFGLPSQFLFSGPKSKGGGCIQGSASECVLISLLAARAKAIKSLRALYPGEEDAILMSKLVGYCSSESHSCVEKASNIALVKFRIVGCNEKFQLPYDVLRQQMEADKKEGLIPFFVSCTLGTTSTCAFDDIEKLGHLCKEEKVWLHVDGAYGGSCLVCPEFRYLIKGIEYASSFNVNPSKWLLVTVDCALMWVRNRNQLQESLVIDAVYLQHRECERAIDFRHWGIPLSRRFRSLKLWFVIRTYGVEGLRKYIREHCRLAKMFESLIRADNRFEILNDVVLGLVCFRLKGSNNLNRRLLNAINKSREVHLTGAMSLGKYFIRLCLTSPYSTESDIRYAFKVCSDFAGFMLELVQKDEKVKKEEQNSMQNEMEDNDSSGGRVVVVDRNSRKMYLENQSFIIKALADPNLYDPKRPGPGRKIKPYKADSHAK